MRIVAFVFGLVLGVATVPVAGHAQGHTDSTYTVQSGDTLYGIARQFGVSVETLQAWNDLDDTTLHEGQMLRIRPPGVSEEETDRDPPPDQSVESDTGMAESAPPPYGRHTVEAGDTFVHLALRLGTTADTLFALNDSTATPLSGGSTVRLPRRFAPPMHVVHEGETLYSIAGEYGVSVRALRAANALDTTSIVPGQRLQLPGRAAPPVPPPGEWATPDSTGGVAVYPTPFAGRLTASGTPYDPDDFVVSHPSLPYGSVVLLSATNANRHVFARVIDRGPPDEEVLLDVSDAVADRLGLEPDANPTVTLRTVWIDRHSD